MTLKEEVKHAHTHTTHTQHTRPTHTRAQKLQPSNCVQFSLRAPYVHMNKTLYDVSMGSRATNFEMAAHMRWLNKLHRTFALCGLDKC